MNTDLINAATAIATGYVSRNLTDPDEIPELIERIARALATVGTMPDDAVHVAAPLRDPAVPVAESVHDDHIVCLEDGCKLKSLKRHLKTYFGLSPEQYRKRWNLPATYPMVAPAHSRRRREIAQTVQGSYRRKAA